MNTLKLNTLEKNILSQKEMNNLNGGESCGCGCLYQSQGGSSTQDNGFANSSGGKDSSEYRYIYDDDTDSAWDLGFTVVS